MTSPTRDVLPRRIRLSIIDRYHVVPETADRRGPHFPIAGLAAFRLREPIASAVFIAALRAVDNKYPQFRLGYRLDTQHYCWQRVPDSELDEHIASMVTVESGSTDLAMRLSSLVSTNNMPLANPLRIFLQDKEVIFKIDHVLGDGDFMSRLIFLVMLATLSPDEFGALPDLPMIFGLPAWRLLTQSPGRAVRVILRSLVSWREWFTPSRPAPRLAKDSPTLNPAVSGSPMKVVLKTLPPAALDALKQVKHAASSDEKVGLTTVLYVLINKRLVELGYIGKDHWYNYVADLHRYLPHPRAFVPGNLLGDLRIHVAEEVAPDVVHECVEVQRKLDRKLETLEPLTNIPMLWLLKLPGNWLYNRVWRSMLNSCQLDPREFFFLTNVGDLSLRLRIRKMQSRLDLAYGTFFAAPVLGNVRLTFCFCIVGGQGNLTLTYDPLVFSETQIQDILALFDQEWLEKQCVPTK